MDILLSMDALVFDVHLLHDPLSSPSLSPIHHRIALLYHSPIHPPPIPFLLQFDAQYIPHVLMGIRQ